jgi:hypothetical protein
MGKHAVVCSIRRGARGPDSSDAPDVDFDALVDGFFDAVMVIW